MKRESDALLGRHARAKEAAAERASGHCYRDLRGALLFNAVWVTCAEHLRSTREIPAHDVPNLIVLWVPIRNNQAVVVVYPLKGPDLAPGLLDRNGAQPLEEQHGYRQRLLQLLQNSAGSISRY